MKPRVQMNANVMGWFETNEAKISTQQELKYYAEIPKALWLVKNFKMSRRNDNSKIFSNQDESWADQERRWPGATYQTDRNQSSGFACQCQVSNLG